MEERSIYLFISYLNKLRNEEEKINQRKLEKNPKQVIENWRHRFGVPNEDTVDGRGSYNIRLQMWHVYSALITKYNKIFFFFSQSSLVPLIFLYKRYFWFIGSWHVKKITVEFRKFRIPIAVFYITSIVIWYETLN